MTYYDVKDTDTDYVVYTCGDVNDASDFSEHLKGIGYKTVVVVRNSLSCIHLYSVGLVG